MIRKLCRNIWTIFLHTRETYKQAWSEICAEMVGYFLTYQNIKARIIRICCRNVGTPFLHTKRNGNTLYPRSLSCSGRFLIKLNYKKNIREASIQIIFLFLLKLSYRFQTWNDDSRNIKAQFGKRSKFMNILESPI